MYKVSSTSVSPSQQLDSFTLNLHRLHWSQPRDIIMSDLQNAIALLIKTFNTYSGKEGDKFTLTKAELKTLLKNELEPLIGKNNDQAAVDAIFDDLDRNKDNSVDFSEYVTLVCALTQMCHEFFKQ